MNKNEDNNPLAIDKKLREHSQFFEDFRSSWTVQKNFNKI